MPTYKAMTFLKNTNLAPAPKLNLCAKATYPIATTINEDPWEQKLLVYPFMAISFDTTIL